MGGYALDGIDYDPVDAAEAGGLSSLKREDYGWVAL